MLRRSPLLILFVLGVLAAPVVTQAQHHFSNCLDGTGNVFSATVVVPTGSTPDIEGAPLPNGSEIAVFSSDPAFRNLCVGVLIWQGSHGYITVWGDDDLTSSRDGLLDNEKLYYRVWDSTTRIEYDAGLVNVTYRQGNGRYANDKIMALADLSVALPLIPFTIEPVDGAQAVSTSPVLTWSPAMNAESYRVQLALDTDPFFAEPVLDSTLATTTLDLADVALKPLTNYHWRVMALSWEGGTDWSNPSIFSTAAFNLVLKKVFLNRKGIKTVKLGWLVEQIPSGKVDVYLDSTFVKRTDNDGTVKHKIKTAGNGPFGLYMCRKNSTDVCSNTVLAEFSNAFLDLNEPDEEEDDNDDFVSYRVGQDGIDMLTLDAAAEVPEEVGLYANYPNPFNDATTIAFGLPETARVTIDIFNMLGQHVTSLVAETMPAGRHTVQWRGGEMSSGVYICRLQVDGVVATRTVTVVR